VLVSPPKNTDPEVPQERQGNHMEVGQRKRRNRERGTLREREIGIILF
jgi:hypothetical protein